MSKISDVDWAQHTKMNYAQNLRKDTEIGKKDPHKIIQGVVTPFHSSIIPGSCCNFIKFDKNCKFCECFGTLGIRNDKINTNLSKNHP